MSEIQSDKPWWVDKEPNFARLQLAIVGRKVILGTDEVKKLEDENERN